MLTFLPVLLQDKALVQAGGTQMYHYESRDGRVRRTSAGGPFDQM